MANDAPSTRKIELIISPEEAARRLKVAKENEAKLLNELLKLEKSRADFESEVAKGAYTLRIDIWDRITPKDISTLKSFKVPPPLVKQIMGACSLVLKGAQPAARFYNERKKEQSYWESGRKLLYDKEFVQKLKSFDPGQVTEETIAEFDKTYANKEWFQSTELRAPSDPVGGICLWVIDRMLAAKNLKATAIAMSKLEGVGKKLKGVQDDVEECRAEVKKFEERARQAK